MANPTTKKAPAPRRQGENGFKYKPRYGLLVPCENEADQQRRYARLTRLGMRPKVVCV
ncbi:hypothetical protein [Oryzisolibacter propanilivorax]|uniref:hypothetical protein n=1 Tax=Oryzisolibacter propanilivorax TaxID=1527607 RepID=UPI00158762D1|nr:hypothetical protein [Oryzisolibacter propanilivorax]